MGVAWLRQIGFVWVFSCVGGCYNLPARSEFAYADPEAKADAQALADVAGSEDASDVSPGPDAADDSDAAGDAQLDADAPDVLDAADAPDAPDATGPDAQDATVADAPDSDAAGDVDVVSSPIVGFRGRTLAVALPRAGQSWGVGGGSLTASQLNSDKFSAWTGWLRWLLPSLP